MTPPIAANSRWETVSIRCTLERAELWTRLGHIVVGVVGELLVARRFFIVITLFIFIGPTVIASEAFPDRTGLSVPLFVVNDWMIAWTMIGVMVANNRIGNGWLTAIGTRGTRTRSGPSSNLERT